MAIDRNTAMRLIQEATNRVQTRWGTHIPDNLRAAGMNKWVIHTSEASLRIPFTGVWNGLFKRTTLSHDSATDFPAPGGFVTPELRPLERKIHVNISAGEYDWVGFLAHEYIHWLSHPNFYPTYYGSVPGKTNSVVEGATDYLMLKCFHGYTDGLTPPALAQYQNYCLCQSIAGLPKQSRAAYNWDHQYDNVKAWVKSSAGNETTLLNFIFNGVAPAVPIPV